MTRRVVVVGTGLIGGSVGLGLRKAGGWTVVGYDAEPSRAERAQSLGAVDEATRDLAEAVADAEIVVVATPVGEVLGAVENIAKSARAGTVVTDVGSAKGTIVEAAEELLGAERPFVGGHPMAGTEGEGIRSASPDLFEGGLWILTPTEGTDPAAYRLINGLVSSLGARTLALDPSTHDRLVALISHVPYAIATALMSLAGGEGDERLFQAAAGSFRDVTRTAGSNPTVWRDIFASNREAFLEELDRFSEGLSRFRAAIAEERWEAFEEIVGGAREARKRFPPKGERAPSEPMTVEVAIPDRAGVLADVTTVLGSGGINIEDLWVDHTPGGGVLRVLVDGRKTAVNAARVLEGKGYRTTVVEQR